mgnify:CR=1 FL=1
MSTMAQNERRSPNRVLDVVETALRAEDIEDLGTSILSPLCEIAGTSSALFYVSDPRLSCVHYVDVGVPLGKEDARSICTGWFDRILDADGETITVAMEGSAERFSLHALSEEGRVLGFVGVGTEAPGLESPRWRRLLATLARILDRLAESASAQRKILHLNTYLTVSSMLARSVDLAELLEIALYCSMEAVAADAASILLLDEEKSSFRFYRVEGSAKPLLGGATFPATEGLAGHVLASREAEIVNDAESDPRFYEKIDRKTGYTTRNLIAVPLVAGDEPVGVLEVLNKADGGQFTSDERLILVSVADEIAFAVRNATIFDYVVNTYCRRRQGQNSCKGCERPLGSWTPCMRYREFLP